ncbi:hemolysin III family protein [Flavicella sp.]|uniref:PAQR family membrane homeostasis protein TrhA n=1 Tax=Flavicella sp. TaxID=2957742 RepID=UPI00301809AE
MKYEVTYYSKLEEKLNIYSHGFGLLLSLIAFPFLIIKACQSNNSIVILSFVIYGVSMIVLYTASTLFHSAENRKYRYYLNIFDHSAIYILIAGTYTPVALVVLQGTLGWIVFWGTWGIALFGVLYKIFFIGKFQIVSTLTYIVMGWMILFAINTLFDKFTVSGLWLLAIGGVLYSIGALFFAINKIPFNHAIFHVFVLLGSLFHFIALYTYVL